MEPNYNSAAELRAFLDGEGLGMRKKFGQNFLINPGVRKGLVEALGAAPGEGVWEIGPGIGAMTALLLERGLAVRAFEIDPGFARVLRGLFAGGGGFTLIEGDVLRTWRGQPPAPLLLGNLPYNIGSALLADFVEGGLFFRRMVVTVQREVAARMSAGPGGADYSSFSVLCASAYRVRPLMLIKGASFYPRPRVDSQGVLLELKEEAASQKRPPCFYPLVRGLFSARRKTVKNNLSAFLAGRGASPGAAAELLAESGIDGGRRAESLCLEEFAALAKTAGDMGLLRVDVVASCGCESFQLRGNGKVVCRRGGIWKTREI